MSLYLGNNKSYCSYNTAQLDFKKMLRDIASEYFARMRRECIFRVE